MSDEQITPVWLTEYRTWGLLIREGAYTSLIEFYDSVRMERVEEEIENEEWDYWEGHAVDYATD